MKPNINYEPLLQMNSIYKQVMKAALKGQHLIISIVVGVILVILLILAPVLVAYPLVGFVIYISYRVRILKNNIWLEFANVNGWQLDTTTPTDSLIPISMQYGHSQHFSPVIQASLGSVDCDLFTFDCTTGGGRYQQVHSFTVARVEIDKALPHMVLLSKKAHADVRQDLENREKLQLEGDFNNYFTLEIEKGQEVDALTILTPDVMQTLVNYERVEDIEIYESNLCFIMRSDKRDYKDMQQLVKSVLELSGKIIEHIHLTSVPARAQTPPPIISGTPPIQPPVTPIPTVMPVPPALPAVSFGLSSRPD